MKHAVVAGLGVLALSTALAPAQEGETRSDCRQKVDRIADRIPDLRNIPGAAAEMGLSEEQLQAALAALDAARIVAHDSRRCDTMVEAAEAMLERSEETASTTTDGPARDAMSDPPVSPAPTPGEVSDRQAAANRLSFEEGPSFGWDGRAASRRFDRGELHPDRPDQVAEDTSTDERLDGNGASEASIPEERWEPLPPPDDESLENWAERARSAREAERRESRAAPAEENGAQRIPDELRGRGETNGRESRATERQDGQPPESRRERETADREAVQRMLQRAERALPTVDFETYAYGFDDGQRVFEFAGTERESGRRVEVDVAASGNIQEIEETIPLEVVPDNVRRAVREVVGRFRVDRTERSLRPRDEIYFEFDGRIATGRPLSIEIRSDGANLKIEERSRG
ncbi:hypothetical protein [Chelativorans salis]|uniref:PepSY domain-containing protein n=1 Tax=Chelativorans salis TaxID=2978478 RepID=A0ABT2LJA1_9HYPH|nr:hypothetical protein [Chelativorans sp. EGI FJ00035]MCT7374114.1 hypothetical protein [Chelativorans sp. EGI FJ00035]